MSREVVDLRLLSLGVAATEFLAGLGLSIKVPTIDELESRSFADSHSMLARALDSLWSSRTKPGQIAILFPKPTDEYCRAQAIACAELIGDIEGASLLLRSEGEGADDVLEALLDVGLKSGRADALLNGRLEIAAKAVRLKWKQSQAAKATHRERVWWHEHVLPGIALSRLVSRAARIKHARTLLEGKVERGLVFPPAGEHVPSFDAIEKHLKRHPEQDAPK